MQTSPTRFKWETSALTHQGKVRKVNQDACIARPEHGFWIVADGMGGHNCGEVASQTITSTFELAQLPEKLSDKVKVLEDNLLAINRHLLLEAMRHGENTVIGSTVVILLAHLDISILLWVGDSRAYRYRDGQLLQLTQDHSQVEEMVKRGMLLREDAENHPLSNIVTRAIGANDALFVDLIDYDIHNDDIFLLCSDGLNKEVKDSEMAELLAQNKSIEEINQSLIELTLQRGARDNVTTILVKAHELVQADSE
ncbi:protein phosphatase 2C domain-containing protein [Vibrio sp. JC009]|uniref:PP2C family protein-serine/threonine phosphatase n=1 Tax=Vibrio sp. JC009 TaxID=2912314 RepID=UPI0023AF73D1|nr:protein phosphatase 2C domain-containing protein [Vibrio sp. JC009]WED22936.1 protein phosphatase 2C domain-containing protein [Vibrio sp. JC009]